jgi:hypothetical protein
MLKLVMATSQSEGLLEARCVRLQSLSDIDHGVKALLRATRSNAGYIYLAVCQHGEVHERSSQFGGSSFTRGFTRS